jgi:hypothetical protein
VGCHDWGLSDFGQPLFLRGTVSNERVSVFVDGSNLYKCLKDEFGKSNIDLEKFCRQLVAERKLIRVYYYNATLPQGSSQAEEQAYQSHLLPPRTFPVLALHLKLPH